MEALAGATAGCDLLAYLDPGTGSLVFQMVIAGLVSAVVTLGTLRRSLVSFVVGMFMRRAGRQANSSSDASPAQASQKSETRRAA